MSNPTEAWLEKPRHVDVGWVYITLGNLAIAIGRGSLFCFCCVAVICFRNRNGGDDGKEEDEMMMTMKTSRILNITTL